MPRSISHPWLLAKSQPNKVAVFACASWGRAGSLCVHACNVMRCLQKLQFHLFSKLCRQLTNFLWQQSQLIGRLWQTVRRTKIRQSQRQNVRASEWLTFLESEEGFHGTLAAGIQLQALGTQRLSPPPAVPLTMGGNPPRRRGKCSHLWRHRTTTYKWLIDTDCRRILGYRGAWRVDEHGQWPGIKWIFHCSVLLASLLSLISDLCLTSRKCIQS